MEEDETDDDDDDYDDVIRHIAPDRASCLERMKETVNRKEDKFGAWASIPGGPVTMTKKLYVFFRGFLFVRLKS